MPKGVMGLWAQYKARRAQPKRTAAA